MAEPLKKCRFCGSECEVNFGRQIKTHAYIKCLGCGIYSPIFESKKQAVEYWNAEPPKEVK